MITRIVKLTFKEGKGAFFIEEFDKVSHLIRGSKGNMYLEAMQDVHNPDVVFTYSKWESEDDLNSYRKSDVFGQVWPTLKKEFAGKPEAWSVETKRKLD